MVELEKHIKDLTVERNPLPVLPNKWHANFGPKEHASLPPGYTHGEVCTHEYAEEGWVLRREKGITLYEVLVLVRLVHTIHTS